MSSTSPPAGQPSLAPLISVVIPSLNRPQMLTEAVTSVLQQSFKDLEVIVVIDGPDGASREAMDALEDERLRVIQHAENQGSAVSRVDGVSAARGEWIAYLDDDDAWMPQKLELQMEVARRSPHHWPIVSCLSQVCYDDHEEVWPRRLPGPNEPISEYLFVRNSLFQGEGLIQTSTLLIPRALHEAVPLSNEGSNHDDWDWMLRVAEHPDVGFEFVSAPLATWNLKTTHAHVSSPDSNGWKLSRDWIRSHHHHVTPLAYASFLLAEVAARAAAAKDRAAFFPLLWEASKKGRVTPKMLLLYLGMWLLTSPVRQLLRQVKQRLLSRNKQLNQQQLSCP